MATTYESGAGIASAKKNALLERLRAGKSGSQSISRRIGSGPAPLSFGQQRLWFLEEMFPGTAVYTIFGACRLRGKWDISAIEKALDRTVARHESLRTSIRLIEGVPMQITTPFEPSLRTTLDLRDLPYAESNAQAARIIKELAQTPFELSGTLCKLLLVRLTDDETLLGIAVHHAIADGWSLSIFYREVISQYWAIVGASPVMLPELKISYADFAEWQRQREKQGHFALDLEYWRKVFADLPPLVTLAPDRARPGRPANCGAREPLIIPSGTVSRLHQLLADGNHGTIFIVLMAAFKALLHRYTGAEDITVGTPIANRLRRELEPMIGFFANTLALRTDLSGNPSFRDLIQRERAVALAAYDHQEIPFESVVEHVQPERQLAQSPLFRTVLVHQNASGTEAAGYSQQRNEVAPGLAIESLDLNTGTTKFDLLVSTQEASDVIRGYIEYDADLYEPASIRAFADRYLALLSAAPAHPDVPIGKVQLCEIQEQAAAVESVVQTADSGTNDCMHRLFEEQARLHPDKVAVSWQDSHLTYAELNARANRLAHRLRELGVVPEVLVGLHVERSLNVVVGILGILKAGGAYLPIDPSYPRERVQFIVADAGAPILITESALASELQCGSNTRLLLLDQECLDAQLDAQSDEDLLIDATPANLCYVIYTSGSTGSPKGTLIQHDNVHRLFRSTDHWFGFNQEDTWTLFHSYSFDFSVWELWGALAYGGRLVVVDTETARAPDRFYDLLSRERVTVLNQTPAAFRQLLNAEQSLREPRDLSLRYIIFGGEALELTSLKPWFARHGNQTRLVNAYGITETTVHVTYRPIELDDIDRAPGHVIGIPIPDLGMYLLDAHGQPVPNGMVGEIHVSGAGLARGYLNRPELSAAKFKDAPFAPGLRLYRTGDLARRLANGEFEYLGRVDHQVKVRGFRVELGEIEAALNRCSRIRDCAVIAREDIPGDQKIVAYVVPRLADQQQNSENDTSKAVSAWQSVFDQTYAQPRSDLPADFNIVGWTSAQRGEAIPECEMRSWVDETVRTLLDLHPNRVLEIGCGSGLLLSRIAPHCEQYHATDFSQVVLDSVRKNLVEQREDLRHVQLYQGAANKLRSIEGAGYDLVIINSVVQYFPSMEYMIDVMDGCLEKLSKGGCLFVGDVRNRTLNLAFHASIELGESTDDTIASWSRLARERADRDSELVLDPAFFTAFGKSRAQVTQIQTRHKRSIYSNELTQFRFDALLAVGDTNEPLATSLKWPQPGTHPDELAKLLEEESPDSLSLYVEGVPNARMDGIEPIMTALSQGTSARGTAELREQVANRIAQKQGIDPEEYFRLADRLPFRVQVLWRPCEPLCYDVALTRQPADETAGLCPLHHMSLPGAATPDELSLDLQQYANRPLTARLSDRLALDIEEHLAGILPRFMLPAAYIFLEHLPVNENGKLNRKELPPPPPVSSIGMEYEAPVGPMEKRLAELFAGVLGLRRVGRGENFFDLGGHSLLAAQLTFQIRDVLDIEVSLQSLFATPTVAGIAAVLQSGQVVSTGPDLANEVHLDATIRGQKPIEAHSMQGEETILLTGATGFVGSYLAQSLLQHTHSRILCLVRAQDSAEAKERLASALESCGVSPQELQRVVAIPGDLSQPRFGMTEREFEALSCGLRKIYHNGAEVNFTRPYSSLKPSNVNGTSEALCLAARSGAAFHYVSTLYVFGQHDSDQGPITENSVPADWHDLRLGYTQSKWVAERLVDLAAERGIETWIYRLGRISGSSRTGSGPAHDLLWHCVRLGLQLGVMLDMDVPLDLTPVDFAADAIVSLSSCQEARTFHLHNPGSTNGGRVLQILAEMGWQFKTVASADWQHHLSSYRNSFSPDDPSYAILGLLANDGSLTSALEFSSSQTRDRLHQQGLSCPKIDDDLLRQYLRNFIATGFLAPPNGDSTGVAGGIESRDHETRQGGVA
ncbi:MAG: amino acid adenylation domain-containing protein [Terracidiphilus sp.]|jgi:amino acid adenylation domain-containing protein/thioester reductase-like protein